MTDDLVWCVRGCRVPCDCDECLTADRPSHGPVRSQAETGLLCRKCTRSLRRWLVEIPDLYATLPLVTRPAEETERRKKPPKPAGSASPIRLDVVTLQDPRTAATSTTGYDPWDGSVFIPQEVGTWALLLAEEHRLGGRLRTLTDATALMLHWLPELCESEWVDECFDAIRSVYRLLQQAHGAERPRPVGRCINVYQRDGRTIACGHALYAPGGGAQIRCAGCGQRYDGRQMLLARLQEQRDAEAAG